MRSSEPDGVAAGKHGVYYSLRRHLAAGGTNLNLSRCFPEPLSRTYKGRSHYSEAQTKVCCAFVYIPGDSVLSVEFCNNFNSYSLALMALSCDVAIQTDQVAFQ